MKRGRVSIISLIVIALTLSGCGVGNNRKAEPVTITLGKFGMTGEQGTVFDKVIEQFTAEHPDIKVDVQDYGSNYYYQLFSKLDSKQGPDVFFVDSSEKDDMVEKGYLSDISGNFSSSDLENFSENMVESFKTNGKLYGVPLVADCFALYYNKDMFNAAGLQPPTNWTELEFDGQKLSKDEYHKALVMPYNSTYASIFMLQTGTKFTSNGTAAYNSSEGVKGLKYFNSLYKLGIAAEPFDVGASDEFTAFMNGNSAMLISVEQFGEQMQGRNNFNLGVTALPKGDEEGTWITTEALSINKQSKQKKEAVELIKFLTSEKTQMGMVDEGVELPTRKSAQKVYSEKYPDKKAFIDMLQVGTPFYFSGSDNKVQHSLDTAVNQLKSDKDQDIKSILDAACVTTK